MTITPEVVPQQRLAARRHRLAASLIDGLIYAVAAAVVYAPFPDEAGTVPADLSSTEVLLNPYAGDPYWWIQILISAMFFAYYWVQHAVWGQTVGKRLCGLMVVSKTGEKPGWGGAAVRALVYPASSALPFAGPVFTLVTMLWIFFDPRKRCLHDLIAGTVVIDTREHRTSSGLLFGLGLLIAGTVLLVLLSVLLAR
ncbi:RDD family protein [Streptosporangium sp. KLBMP 9127]|nr:RDD family protein [Streptosporangium sp. KLBMP 9127]